MESCHFIIYILDFCIYIENFEEAKTIRRKKEKGQVVAKGKKKEKKRSSGCLKKMPLNNLLKYF